MYREIGSANREKKGGLGGGGVGGGGGGLWCWGWGWMTAISGTVIHAPAAAAVRLSHPLLPHPSHWLRPITNLLKNISPPPATLSARSIRASRSHASPSPLHVFLCFGLHITFASPS